MSKQYTQSIWFPVYTWGMERNIVCTVTRPFAFARRVWLNYDGEFFCVHVVVDQVIVEEVDAEGNPFSYLKLLEFGGVVSKSCPPGRGAPLECEIPPKGGEVRVNLSFQAHYGEPDLSLCFQVKPGEGKCRGEEGGGVSCALLTCVQMVL